MNIDTVYYETFDGSGNDGYTNDAFPDITTTGCEIHTLRWYDNYDFLDLLTPDAVIYEVNIIDHIAITQFFPIFKVFFGGFSGKNCLCFPCL